MSFVPMPLGLFLPGTAVKCCKCTNLFLFIQNIIYIFFEREKKYYIYYYELGVAVCVGLRVVV